MAHRGVVDGDRLVLRRAGGDPLPASVRVWFQVLAHHLLLQRAVMDVRVVPVETKSGLHAGLARQPQPGDLADLLRWTTDPTARQMTATDHASPMRLKLSATRLATTAELNPAPPGAGGIRSPRSAAPTSPSARRGADEGSGRRDAGGSSRVKMGLLPGPGNHAPFANGGRTGPQLPPQHPRPRPQLGGGLPGPAPPGAARSDCPQRASPARLQERHRRIRGDRGRGGQCAPLPQISPSTAESPRVASNEPVPSWRVSSLGPEEITSAGRG